MRVFHLFGHYVVRGGEIVRDFYPYFYSTKRGEVKEPVIAVEETDLTAY